MDYGNFVSGGFGLLGSTLNFAYNSALAAQQNKYNLDMWKLQAEYNSPQAQMKRFEEAGLNPKLIYGQGNNGNMTSAPQMVTPQAPELTHAMQKLGEAFNIEGLRTTIANRKKAEAEAQDAKTNATRNARELFAEEAFGRKYTYDYVNGKYVLRSTPGPNEVLIVNPSAYYMNRILENNYNRGHLIPVRAGLIGAQRSYLQPQIQMLNYERKYQPYSFWIGQGSKVLNALPLPGFKFNFGKGGYHNTTTFNKNY